MIENNMILIVDDQKAVANTMKMSLEIEGYVAEVAYSGKSALEMATSYPYDAVLLDINLGDVDGTDLISKLIESNSDIVIIMITGYPNQGNAMAALNYGAHGYLVKPVSRDELLTMLEEKLQQQKANKELTQEKMASFIQNRLEKLHKM